MLSSNKLQNIFRENGIENFFLVISTVGGIKNIAQSLRS